MLSNLASRPPGCTVADFMRYGIVLALVIFSAFSAPAATPTEESVAEMMRVMKLEALLNQTLKGMDDAMTKQMEQNLETAIKGRTLSSDQKTAVVNFHEKFLAAMKAGLSFGTVKLIYMQAYRDTFTQDEVDAIIAFYKSPAGKAITEKNPEAMATANRLMKTKISPLEEKLQTMLDDFLKELERTK
jgi:uncharacterized protein